MSDREKAERWKPIPSLPGYKASSWGRIRLGGRDVKVRQDPHGALIFQALVNGSYATRRVARVVGEVFCPDFDEALRPRFADGCPTNCCPENLIWDTPNAGRKDERHIVEGYVPLTTVEEPAKETCKKCRKVASRIRFVPYGKQVPDWAKKKGKLSASLAPNRMAAVNCIYHYCEHCDHEWVGPTWGSKILTSS